MCTVPVLFIIFNKIEETKKVFETIRLYKPDQLFIAADGPRLTVDGENLTCSAIRSWIIDNIDWACDVHTLFREQNIGCGRGPSEAITWFFNHVEEGIILEDDCLPNQSFFTFCHELLSKYRHNQAISAISGNNFQPVQPMDISSDYYFSIFPSSWGWATWRRAWQGFDFNLSSWDKFKTASALKFIFSEQKYYLWWKHRFDWMYKDQPQDMWDFQFHYHSMMNRQLAIIPNANLVSNIGHGASGTHFQDPNAVIASLPTYDLSFPLNHPSRIARNYNADVYIQKLLFGEVEVVSLYKRFKRIVKQVI
ncbi:nucleotide-diphospho-sugar transferase [Spirosoma sp. BT702]|uniref:Nucleotide-diphospho-sugar transferase n=1 Tax=Spirosoma profusum TaxID=2771354 RepID=A0A927ATN4_9BACT|nr:nucleotide-diphospho-sugar transferase [Spirosoma profusum]MBD2700677.1 nucleotide-diphospho-sugar transferase [Spirosoma profusum]